MSELAAPGGLEPAAADASRREDGALAAPERLEPYTRHRPRRQAFAAVDPAANPPVRLYYELYGTGETKVLFVMGFQTTAMAWEEQVEFFSGLPAYQLCIFDNRGIGRSDAPRGLYSTSQMANDTLKLLDIIGWKPENVHVVGVSLGGMISQEIGLLSPGGLKSLCLTSTHSGRAFMSPTTAALMLSTIFEKDDDKRMDAVVEVLFPPEWRDAKVNNGSERTNREAFKETIIRRNQIAPRAQAAGVAGQMCAVFRHHVSKARLRRLGQRGFPVMVVTGDKDRHIGCPLVVLEGVGHGPGRQCTAKYNAVLLRFFEQAEGRLLAD